MRRERGRKQNRIKNIESERESKRGRGERETETERGKIEQDKNM